MNFLYLCIRFVLRMKRRLTQIFADKNFKGLCEILCHLW